MVSQNKIFIKIKNNVTKEINSHLGNDLNDMTNTLDFLLKNIDESKSQLKYEKLILRYMEDKCNKEFKSFFSSEFGYENIFVKNEYVSNGKSSVTGVELTKAIPHYNIYLNGNLVFEDVANFKDVGFSQLLENINYKEIKNYLIGLQIKTKKEKDALSINLSIKQDEYEKYTKKIFKSKEKLDSLKSEVKNIQDKLLEKSNIIKNSSLKILTLEQKIKFLQSLTYKYYNTLDVVKRKRLLNKYFENKLEDFLVAPRDNGLSAEREKYNEDKINILVDNSILDKAITNSISQKDIDLLRKDKKFLHDMSFELVPDEITAGKKVYDSNFEDKIDDMIHRKIYDSLQLESNNLKENS